MAKRTDPHPDSDDLDFSEESERPTGLPDAPKRPSREHVGDLSTEKETIPAFQTQDRKAASRLKGMDLEGAEDDGLGETIDPKTVERSKQAAKRAEEAATVSPERQKERERQSGNEKEEELRREGGRPKSVRPADFEPTAWESSSTKLDRRLDEDGQLIPKVGIGSCFKSVLGALKGAWAGLNVMEMASVVAFLLVALVGLFIFRNLVHSGERPEAETRPLLSAVSFPAKGDLLTINEISAKWREPKDGEVVRVGILVVPEVAIQLGGGSGYLRIMYRDETGKIRGDTFAEQVSGGKIAGQGTFTAVCSEGYQNTMKLVECQAGRLEPWSVEIFESQDYDVPIAEWKSLAYFDMPTESDLAAFVSQD